MTLPDITTEISFKEDENAPTRLGTRIDVGAVLDEEKMDRVRFKMAHKWQFYSAYPDIWVDELLIPEGSEFKLLTYQRIFLRTIARSNSTHITGARGVSKTFITFLALIRQAIFKPTSVWGFAAPNKGQSAKIASQTFMDLIDRFPLIRNEIIGGKPAKNSENNFEVVFKNGSRIIILAALDSSRGIRLDGLAVDETRDQNGNDVHAILIPMLTKVRKTVGKELSNPYEKQQIQIYTTSASSKSSYNYEKVLDIFLTGIISPNQSVALGLDYSVPVAEGIYPQSFIDSERNSSTMSPEDFAREYLSQYSLESGESWFDFKRIGRHRTIEKAEWEYTPSKHFQGRIFYTLSCDVGRLNDNTAVHVYKNYVKDGKILTKIINTMILGRTAKKATFYEQAIDLKKLIAAFKAEDVVIDTNGLGIGLAEQMVREQTDSMGVVYPAYGFHDDKDFQKIQPAMAPTILSSFKGTANLNSELFSNCYTRIDSGRVDFLIEESKARTKLLGLKSYKNMSLEEKTMRLMPFEMTSKLMEEMGNQRLKRSSGVKIQLEPINTRFPDDRFSSLCLGLYRIKQIEEKLTRRNRLMGQKRNLVFYTGR